MGMGVGALKRMRPDRMELQDDSSNMLAGVAGRGPDQADGRGDGSDTPVGVAGRVESFPGKSGAWFATTGYARPRGYSPWATFISIEAPDHWLIMRFSVRRRRPA